LGISEQGISGTGRDGGGVDFDLVMETLAVTTCLALIPLEEDKGEIGEGGRGTVMGSSNCKCMTGGVAGSVGDVSGEERSDPSAPSPCPSSSPPSLTTAKRVGESCVLRTSDEGSSVVSNAANQEGSNQSGGVSGVLVRGEELPFLGDGESAGELFDSVSSAGTSGTGVSSRSLGLGTGGKDASGCNVDVTWSGGFSADSSSFMRFILAIHSSFILFASLFSKSES
jgi:hypothetical protein